MIGAILERETPQASQPQVSGLPERLAQPARPFVLPQTPEEFRIAVGLLGETSFPAEDDFAKKEASITKVVREKQVESSHMQFATERSSLTYQDNSIQAQLSDQSLKTRLWRVYMEKRLGMMGLKQGPEILHVIESSVPIYNRQNINPKSVARLIRSLDPVDENAALAKFNLAIVRARKFDFLPAGHDFKDGQTTLIDTINTLVNIPEETFNKLEQQFNGRTEVIYYPGSFAGEFSLRTSLLPILKQGELTSEQMEMLDKAIVWNYFADALPFKSKDSGSKDERNYEFWLQFTDLSDPQIPQQFNRLYPYLVDWASGRLSAIQEREAKGLDHYYFGDESGRDFTSGLLHLDSAGQLGKLDLLIKAGWDCSGIYRKMKEGSAQVQKVLDEAVAFQSDPVKTKWAKALNEFYYPNAKLPAGDLEHLRVMLENKDSLIRIALITNALPKIEGFELHELLVEEGDAVIGLDRYHFNEYLDKVLNREDLAEAGRIVAQGIRNLLNINNRKVYNLPTAFSPEELSFYSYLILNKDRIAGQINSDSYNRFDFDAGLINELVASHISPPYEQFLWNQIHSCSNQQLLSSDLKMRYLDALVPEERIKALLSLPEDFLATSNPQTQNMVRYFRTLDPSLQIALAVGGKEEIVRCIGEGKPTFAMMEYFLNRGPWPGARPLFTPEVLNSFPEDKKDFIQAVMDLPLGAAKLMKGKMHTWEDYFISGKPTDKFLRMVAEGYGGEIDELIASADLTHLPPENVQFWNYFKTISGKSNLRAHLLTVPAQMFPRLIVEGHPTGALLDTLAKKSEVSIINELISSINLKDLTEEQQRFWSFYPKIKDANLPILKHVLLANQERFAEFIEDDKPTLTLLNFASSINNLNDSNKFQLRTEIFELIDWTKLPPKDRMFWEYIYHDRTFEDFLIENQEDFSQLVVDGHETHLYYQKLLEQRPLFMLDLGKHKPGLSVGQYQNFWRMALGKENVDRFLAALPKATDEARNALTGNKYDHTTEFLKFLMRADTPLSQIGLNTETLPVVTAFIEKLGLSRNKTLYEYFHNLYLFEHKKIDNLPEEMRGMGIESAEQMVQKLAEVRRMVFETELRDPAELRHFSPFQIEMLANVTGYDSARFYGGDANSLGGKISNFADNLEKGEIPALPLGYETETIESSGIKVEFNTEAIRENYAVLQKEILEAIDDPPSLDSLKAEVKDLAKRRVDQLGKLMEGATNEKALIGMRRDLNNYQSCIEKVDGVSDMESLAVVLLGMNFSKEDRAGGLDFRGMDSMMRRIILTKLYQRHTDSPGFLENVRIKLSKDEITAEGIDEIILTLDEMVKNHVLNLDQKNKEHYWSAEVFSAILSNESLSKNFRRIMEKFNPHADKLRQEQARFIKTQTGAVSKVKIIPDRGLAGEMAGYLADVCYTRVNNLLKTYSGINSECPMVVPYKFVVDDVNLGYPRFVGSVLVFEVQTAKGEPALLVRALDIPDEAEIDVGKFTENLLDKFADLAKRRGKKKVLVAGTGGTISNYTSITNHVLSAYVRGKESDPVNPKFDFNQYDITNSVYVARTVE